MKKLAYVIATAVAVAVAAPSIASAETVVIHHDHGWHHGWHPHHHHAVVIVKHGHRD